MHEAVRPRRGLVGAPVRFVVVLALTALVPQPAVAQESCRFARIGEGRVADALDARTLRLDDGREIRLAGLESDAGFEDGRAALRDLAAGRDVALHGPRPASDRYGRTVAVVVVAGSGDTLQAELARRGAVAVSGAGIPRDCAAYLTRQEAEARASRRGLWREPAALKNAEMPDDILARIGQFAVVEGKVISVREAGATVYINFGRRWTRDLAVTISKRGINAFETAGLTPKSLEGRRIRVRGFVERRGGPRIHASGPEQIEIAGVR